MESHRQIISKKSVVNLNENWFFNQYKTLASLGSNVVSALFVVFLLTLIFDQNQFANLTNPQRIILLLCPAFAAGNIGDLLLEFCLREDLGKEFLQITYCQTILLHHLLSEEA